MRGKGGAQYNVYYVRLYLKILKRSSYTLFLSPFRVINKNSSNYLGICKKLNLHLLVLFPRSSDSKALCFKIDCFFLYGRYIKKNLPRFYFTLYCQNNLNLICNILPIQVWNLFKEIYCNMGPILMTWSPGRRHFLNTSVASGAGR